MNAIAINAITPTISFENATVLARLLDTAALPASIDALAAALEKDPSNFRKLLKRMEEEGTVQRAETGFPWAVTRKGERILQAVEVVAQGLPAGAVHPDGVWDLDKIERNPNQPRVKFDEGEISGLADTIEEAGGLLFPIILRPADASGVRMLQDGERRWRACRLLRDEGRLPAALASGLPYREREPDKADGALIALIANNTGVHLDPWEDAKALARVADAYGWSGRELAKRVGRVTDDSETGVRDVQEKLKVVREARAEDIARHEAGEITWEELRATVRQAKPASAPAASAAEQQSLIESETWEEGRQKRIRAGIERLTSAGLCALVELADKVDRSPLDGRPRSTRCGQHYPDRTGTATALVMGAGCGFGGDDAMISDVALAWLEEHDLRASVGDRQAVLRKAREGVASPARIVEAETNDTYITPWLNEDHVAAVPAAGAKAQAKGGEAGAVELSASQTRALVELRHRLQLAADAYEHQTFGRMVPVGSYWLDQLVSDLTHAGMIKPWHMPGGSPHLGITDQGEAWLAANGFPGQITIPQLDRVRADGGQAFWPHPHVYVAEWLNPTDDTASAATAPAEAVQIDIEDGDPDEAEAKARDTLAAVAKGLAGEAPDYPAILAAVGLTGPFEPPGGDDAGSVFTADGAEAATIDQHRELPDDLAHARALVVAAILNGASGHAA